MSLILVSDIERAVVNRLIEQAESVIREIVPVLGEDSEPVQAVRHAYDWLRGFRDAGYWVTSGDPAWYAARSDS